VADFEASMKGAMYQLRTREKVLDNTHDDLINGGDIIFKTFGNTDIQAFYQNYITDYAAKRPRLAMSSNITVIRKIPDMWMKDNTCLTRIGRSIKQC